MNLIILFSSVILGIIIVYTLKPKPKLTQILLTFSGAYLLAITITHLLPEVYSHGSDQIGIYILLGLLLQLIIDYFSRGVEHGHIHVDNHEKFPYILFISLGLHAFMEGIPLGHDEHEGLLWAIVVHKIPVTIVLGSFLLHSKASTSKSLILLILFSLMSPLGSYFGGNIDFLIKYKNEITSIIVGIFLHISTIIIFESSKNHKINLVKFFAILTGFAVAFII